MAVSLYITATHNHIAYMDLAENSQINNIFSWDGTPILHLYSKIDNSIYVPRMKLASYWYVKICEKKFIFLSAKKVNSKLYI